MRRDLHGLPITAASDAAAAAFDRTVVGYVKYRADTPERLARTLAADPEFGLAHCLQGYLAMTSFRQANVAIAAKAAAAARPLIAAATPREQAHLAALDAWIEGDLDRMLGVWGQILADHPTDLLAFRLAHFVNFWLGRPAEMRASVESLTPKWGRELAGHGTLLSCRCFASEECGDYADAEPAGWEALASDPADYWGIHALAHIMEMQGRHRDGIALLQSAENHADGVNNVVHHLWWHRALFHFERREFETVLDLYDRRFRNLASPLTQAVPDLYIDVQNAASMLFRLERQGVAVGDRWIELADKAEARIGDCLSPFTLPHWMMALAATGRDEAAQAMLAGMREFNGGTVARVVREVASPICAAVLEHRRGEHDRAVELMWPVLDRMVELGGSHAQQDVLYQLYVDAAAKAGCDEDIRAALARVARGRTAPPAQRVGYAHAASGLTH